MSNLELFILALGLSMDAFAVSICKGLAMEKASIRKSAIVGLWFGTFQAMMPLIGYFLGIQFAGYVTKLAPWIAFALLSLIGGNMIKEACEKENEEEEKADSSLAAGTMFLLAIATSIDALAVGITFAMLKLQNVPLAVSFIGITTFCISVAGVKIGNIFGSRYKKRAELAGGAILILLGLKIILEHFGVVVF
ncbi:MAG: manganese efflux pump [Lachnospiraceae bacterium]|nr:manganese efflux pump [Lachnospiraceae bacterium]